MKTNKQVTMVTEMVTEKHLACDGTFHDSFIVLLSVPVKVLRKSGNIL